jgi:hypothetical protein
MCRLAQQRTLEAPPDTGGLTCFDKNDNYGVFFASVRRGARCSFVLGAPSAGRTTVRKIIDAIKVILVGAMPAPGAAL